MDQLIHLFLAVPAAYSPAVPPNRPPSGTGLFLSSTYMGFYDSGTWATYIQDDGTMWMRGATTPDATNGYQGLWWDAPNDVLNIYGDIYLSNSREGTSTGPIMTVSEHGLISMGADGLFEMGTSSSFTAAENSTFQIGDAPGDYLNFSNGVLTLKGKIVVTDGGDVNAIAYTPEATSLWSDTPSVASTYFYFYFALLPYCGFVEMVDGNRYNLVDDTSGVDTRILRANDRDIVFFVHKDGTGIANANAQFGSRDYWGIDNYGTQQKLVPMPSVYTTFAVDLVAMNQDLYYSTYNVAERANHIQLGHAYLNGNLSAIDYVSGAGVSGSTTIGPGFIQTNTLSAISADLGAVTAGSIVVGSTNKLWLNDNATAPTVALAIGGSTKASAPFRVYEDGDFHAGGASDNYLDWNGSALTVKGTIQADAGQINGNLTIESSGNLRMNGGKIQWQNDGGTYRSYIDNSKIVISEASGYSLTKIGDTTAPGLIDLTMFSGASSAWDFGIRIVDGGNSEAGVSALYRGVSGVVGVNSVDRIFSAATASGSRSDGFHAVMAAYDNGDDFDAAGACFKGLHSDGGPVALFNQNGSTGPAPVVWMGSNKVGSRLIFGEIGATSQTGIFINNPSGYTDFVALSAGNGGIENVRYQRFINLATATAGAGDVGVPAASGTNEFIVYARQGALRMKNSLYEWTFSAGSPTSL